MLPDIYKRRMGFYFPVQIQAVGALIILIGVGLIEVTYGISVIIIIGGLFLSFLSYGYKIDFVNKRYKSHYSILGIDLNGWYEMPNVKYLSLRKQAYTKTYSVRVNSMSVSEVDYEVNIIFEDNDYLKVGSFKKLEDAQKHAQQFAEKLKVVVEERI